MFGSSKLKKEKTKIFSSDNERKRFFAIKANYAKKNNKSIKSSSIKKKSK